MVWPLGARLPGSRAFSMYAVVPGGEDGSGEETELEELRDGFVLSRPVMLVLPSSIITFSTKRYYNTFN